MAEVAGFVATQREEDGSSPGAVAVFPYDRMTVEQFRVAFPRARWRDELGAWFVPGTTAARRLNAWQARAWPGVLAHADGRGQDAFSFEPITSRYLATDDDGFVVRTPYSRAVVEALRTVPWARWDPASKAWRVPYRSYEALRRQWPDIEEAAGRAEPAERQKRRDAAKASGEHARALARAAERRRHRHPVPDAAQPPLDRVLMTAEGPVVFESITGELVEADTAASFYPGVSAGGASLIWATWRRPSHAELVSTWPARAEPGAADTARGWWQPTIEVLREARRQAASVERARVTRGAKQEN